MFWRIEKHHAAIVEYLPGVGHQKGRQVHIQIFSGRMRHQNLAIGNTEARVLAWFNR
ncbi:hypothetical protein D3C80_1645960 [compost metagenome]